MDTFVSSVTNICKHIVSQNNWTKISGLIGNSATRDEVPPDCSEPSDLSGLDQNYLPWLAVKISLDCLFRTVDIYYYCDFLYILHLNSLQFFFSLFDQIFSSNICFQLTFSSATLSNHCSTIIWLLFDLQSAELINIIQVQDLPTFVFESCHCWRKRDLRNQFLWLGRRGLDTHYIWLFFHTRSDNRRTSVLAGQTIGNRIKKKWGNCRLSIADWIFI